MADLRCARCLTAGAILLPLLLVGCTSGNAGFVAGSSCTPGAKDSPCIAGTVCDSQARICTCPPGAALCGGGCPDLLRDVANCGGCGLVCPPGEGCAAGRCSGGRCASGALECGGACIDPKNNARHCGGCDGAGGRSCGDGQQCVNGACAAIPCAFGATQCGTACVDLRSSAGHCGACGNACGAGTVCANGACIGGSCPSGLTACGAACVNLLRDQANCGACNNACSSGHVCAAEGGKAKCREYRFAGCLTCPCPSCGERACCSVAKPGGGYGVLCVENQCPL